MLRVTLGTVGLALSCSTILLAQAAGGGAPAGGDTLARLLVEVRQLRIAMERSATIAPRIQLLTNRLSLQETRVSRIALHLDNVREQLSRLPEDQRRVGEEIKRYEAMLAENLEPQARREVEMQLRSIKLEAERIANEEQRLRARESDLLLSYTTEQATWQEINNRLHELERSLARP